MSLKTVYQISDIHLRNVKRHVEYRQVFMKLFAEIRKRGTKDAIIYLAGDIVHSKLELSPELITEVSWLFTECSKLCPTIMITGNHDCNMNNSDRMDALSPIVEALNLPNFTYLRDSQVYYVDDVAFGVMSIFGKREDWPKPDSIEFDGARVKVALFHGPIDNSITDVGYVVSSRHYNTDIFDNFDVAMCGDIHKKQEMLSPSGCKIVYGGSCLQQNFGESLDGHGMIVWDMDTLEYESVDIPNDYGYYTMYIDKGVVPDALDIPKFPRLRVKMSNTDAVDAARAITEIKLRYNLSEFAVIHTDSFLKNRNNPTVSKLDFDDLSDVTHQNELMRNYVKRISPSIDQASIEKLEEINADINSRISLDDLRKNINWKPIRFEFSNMFSYGEDNVIDFTNMNGLVGLFAANATGKSSIMSAMSFCLFDKCERAFKAVTIMNSRKDTFHCKLDFQVDGVDYTIQRDAKTIRDKVKVDVQFWKTEAGVVTSLNGTERRDTNSVIEQYVGKYDDFALTAYSVQGNNALFIDKSQSERKDMLSQFMGLGIFDKLFDVASDDIKEVTTLIKNFKKTDFTTELSELETSFGEKKVEYNQLDADLKDLDTQKNNLESQIVQLSTDIVPIDAKLDLESLERERVSLESNISNTQTAIPEKTTSISDIAILMSEMTTSIEEHSTVNGVPIDTAKSELDKYTTKINSIGQEISMLKQSLISNRQKLERLAEHKYDPNCKFCVDNVFVKDAIKTREIVTEQEATLVKLEAEKVEYIGLLAPLSDVAVKWDELRELKSKYQNNIVRQEKLEAELKGLLTKKELYETQLVAVLVNIDKYYTNEETIQHNKKLAEDIKILKDEKTQLDYNINSIKQRLLKITSDAGSIKTSMDNIKKKIIEVKELEVKNQLYMLYIESVKRDGIPYELISNSLPVIESEINLILGQMVDFHILLDTDGKNINARIVYEDRDWALEMCSGMEKFISGLAIRVALINICNLPRPNFLVIDEGFGTMDSDNMASLHMLFEYLKNQFGFILIISHVDQLRDIVDVHIDIKKVNDFSKVTF